MSVSKPYYRVARPDAFIPNYINDERYARDHAQLSRAYINIEKELSNVFNYIEPSEDNKFVYSLEIYTLLLRACTEVELNCKLIMEANEAESIGKYFTMRDYIKLEQSSRLSKYIVTYNNWRTKDNNGRVMYTQKILRPFENFGLKKPESPQWYCDYNQVKHNRERNLEKANLDNCMNAIAAIFVLLYSQFGASCINSYRSSGKYEEMASNYGLYKYDYTFDADVIFDIEPPSIKDWEKEELYKFDWNKLCDEKEPFQKFIFK